MGMPLVMIFALIVGAIVLAWGIYMIWQLVGQAECVEMADKLEDLKADVDVFSNFDEGATKKIDMRLPASVDVVCFYDDEKEFDCELNGNSCASDFSELMQKIMIDDDNMYISPAVCEFSRFNVEDLLPKEKNPVCISNGKMGMMEKTEEGVVISYYE